MKQLGFGFFGIVDLEESSPHRSKTTAWGSWMSPSAPYIYNPKECVILAYKNLPKKQVKGTPQWKGEYQMVPKKRLRGVRKKLVMKIKIRKTLCHWSLVNGITLQIHNRKLKRHSLWIFRIERLRFVV